MAIPSTTNAGLASDATSINALRSSASRDPKAAVKETAKQFEALFMQELMKSMRAASMSSGMLDNEGSKLGTEMLDQQFATKMTGLPGGLSDMIAKQLERQLGVATGLTPPNLSSQPSKSAAAVATPQPRIPSKCAGDFVKAHDAAAKAVEAQTGIPASFMIAQAAHETGWGRKEIRGADGTDSHNLFGIKAGPGWTGPVAEVTTTEYINGRPQKVKAQFRAYASYEESFRDYAKLLKDSPRYAGVVANASSAKGFAQGLQRAGYATDPAYAEKLSKVINTTLRLQRVA
ncbi:MAG: flagellar assembly peptidoglycan hydrolase FlgJ [Betaproteobacteria bacterium]|nr:MAG: flagellar assembly peptidoglycan hydrolase FlgJ [Betaproteobacteria bacterium]